MSFKSEVIGVLTPIFGEQVKQIIEENYSADEERKLYDLAHLMLSGYMGRASTEKILCRLERKYPELKPRL